LPPDQSVGWPHKSAGATVAGFRSRFSLPILDEALGAPIQAGLILRSNASNMETKFYYNRAKGGNLRLTNVSPKFAFDKFSL